MTLAEKLQKIAENAPKVFAAGKEQGYQDGYEEGKEQGYQEGYEAGLNDSGGSSGGGDNGTGELVWTEYKFPYFGAIVSIANASENFPSGTYRVKTEMGEADSTWYCDTSAGAFSDYISFSNGLEGISVNRIYIEQFGTVIDNLEFQANFPASYLYLAKID